MLADRTRFVATVLVISSLAGRAAAAPDDERVRARSFFQDGSDSFRRGHYEDAIESFRKAYQLDPAAALLLNIAQAARLKAPPDCAEALRHYELFLAAEPRAPERPEIERNMAAMRTCLEERVVAEPAAAVVAVPPPPTPSPPPPIAGSPAAPWLAIGGATLAVAGAGLYARARYEWNQLEPTCPCPDETVDRWQTITNASYGLMAVGAATSAIGLLWWWRGASERGPSLSVAPWMRGAQRGVALGGRF